jgi:hypothetical protein
MWFPDGSRKPTSIPYGCSCGSPTNSTPRAESSANAARQSSVARNTPAANPFATTLRRSRAVSSSIIGGPMIGISTIATSS